MKPDPTSTIKCRDINNSWHEAKIEQFKFRPSVYGVIIRDDSILLAKQIQGYDLPGGGIELGEATTDALVREVKEETGMDVAVDQLITCEHSFFKGVAETGFYHSIMMYYRCHVVGGDLSIDGLDEYEKEIGDMPEWVALEKLDEIHFASSIDCHKVIRKALTIR
jgi:ADP-ribose pyrophosphatase YjhB (NUDIX family)